MGFYFGLTTELMAIAAMGAVQWWLAYRVNSLIKSYLPPVPARLLCVTVRIVVAAITLGLILSVPHASRLPLTRFLGYLRGVSLLWAFTSTAACSSIVLCACFAGGPRKPIPPGAHCYARQA